MSFFTKWFNSVYIFGIFKLHLSVNQSNAPRRWSSAPGRTLPPARRPAAEPVGWTWPGSRGQCGQSLASSGWCVSPVRCQEWCSADGGSFYFPSCQLKFSGRRSGSILKEPHLNISVHEHFVTFRWWDTYFFFAVLYIMIDYISVDQSSKDRFILYCSYSLCYRYCGGEILCGLFENNVAVLAKPTDKFKLFGLFIWDKGQSQLY